MALPRKPCRRTNTGALGEGGMSIGTGLTRRKRGPVGKLADPTDEPDEPNARARGTKERYDTRGRNRPAKRLERGWPPPDQGRAPRGGQAQARGDPAQDGHPQAEPADGS